MKKDQGSNNSRRGSKQMKEIKANYSTTSGDDPDLESDAKSPKKFRKKKHKDSDFFASSDSDHKGSHSIVELNPVKEEVQVIL